MLIWKVFCKGRAGGKEAGRPLEKGGGCHHRTWTDGDLEHTKTARSDWSAPKSHLEIHGRVLYGYFVSYLEISGLFGDFLCPHTRSHTRSSFLGIFFMRNTVIIFWGIFFKDTRSSFFLKKIHHFFYKKIFAANGRENAKNL